MPANAIDRKLPIKYEPEIALRIAEEIAGGKTLVEVAALDGIPTRTTIYRWLAVYPKFFDAYERAREVSAQSFEDEALQMARDLAGPNDFTGTKVQAYNIAMQQLRWSAARRDKARYGQQTQIVSTVPIQINTTLNLGQEGMPAATDIAQSVYTIDMTATSVPAETEGYDDDTVERLVAAGSIVDTDAGIDDNDELPFGLPKEEKQQLHNPRPGRPKKGHKPLAATKAAITRAKNKEA